MVSLHLPWKPIYTQSGGFDWAGGIAAKAASTNNQDNDNDPPTLLWWSWSLSLTIAFTLLVYVMEKALDGRQKGSYQQTEFPKQLEQTVAKIDAQGYKQRQQQQQLTTTTTSQKDEDTKNDDEKPLLQQLQDKFKSSQSYGLDKINFGMIASTYDTLESIFFLLLGFLPYLWDLAVRTGHTYLGYTVEQDEIKISLLFLLFITLVGTVTSLPFELYSTFGIEKKHGFNKQTYGLFLSDKVKSLFLTFLIGGPFVALLLKIIKV
jgi:hypothetical protein